MSIISKILLESEISNTVTMYSGCSNKVWETVWKNKNFKDKLSNVTSDIDFAIDYSYDFETGKYDDIVVELTFPIDAIYAYRNKNYKNDDDFKPLKTLQQKLKAIEIKTLFLVDLYNFKNSVTVKLIKA